MSELLTPDELKETITKNYNQYKAEDQTRNERGRLTDPLAETFEVRMNRALDEFGDFMKFGGEVALLGQVEA